MASKIRRNNVNIYEDFGENKGGGSHFCRRSPNLSNKSEIEIEGETIRAERKTRGIWD